MSAVLLALLAVPFGSAIVCAFIPGNRPQAVRSLALVSGAVQFALALTVFIAYQYEGGNGLRFDLRWDWLENVAFLGNHGIALHLAVDGIAAPLVLLNGIVIFAAVFVSWNIEHRNKDFFLLLFLLVYWL